jgi:glycosyltransferase involved in cell wall biosynthesis
MNISVNKEQSAIIKQEEMLMIPAVEISSTEKLPLAPVVSVVMMTRNHDKYIEQAVESVVGQKCEFPVELLIGEDFSKDNTRDKCFKLQEKYPNLVRLIVASNNVGITNNFLRLACRAKGKYIALLEGDDYWTNPEKLVKQFSIMESHPDYSWCGAKTLNRTFWAKEKEFYDIEDVLNRYIMHTSSIMFRSELIESYPRFPDIVAWESMLCAYLTERGKCGFLNEVVSYYRRHEGGLWTGANLDNRMRMTKIFTNTMDQYFNYRYTNLLFDRELWIYKMDTAICLGKGFWQHWMQSLYIVRTAFPRIVKVLPGQYILFAIGVFFQPLSALYFLLRRQLALRRRVSAFKTLFKRNTL